MFAPNPVILNLTIPQPRCGSGLADHGGSEGFLETDAAPLPKGGASLLPRGKQITLPYTVEFTIRIRAIHLHNLSMCNLYLFARADRRLLALLADVGILGDGCRSR